MATIDRPDPVILSHVLGEHRDLFRLMSCVRSAFAEADELTLGRCACVLESLHHLRDHLHDHFAQEEKGGFLEEAICRVPRLSAAVQSIISQHPGLLAQLDELINALDASSEPTPAWSRAGHAFETFSEHMTAHERAENAAVQEGYNEDLGLVE
ncbi:MAG: hemerythrin domain-containing protein [Planctomycetota bacterium]